MSARGFLFFLFLWFFGLDVVTDSLANAVAAKKGTTGRDMEEMVPVTEMRMIAAGMVNESGSSSRRALSGSFQICALCTCCGGAQGYCLPSPCCYAINCNIPNRPFGFCAFTPKTCNCFGCTNA